MGRIDDGSDLLVAQVAHESLDAAEATDARGQGLRRWLRRAAGQRQRRLEARVVREQAGEGRGFGGAAEDENAHVGVRR